MRFWLAPFPAPQPPTEVALAHRSSNGRAIRPFSFCVGVRVMDEAMNAFVERQNIVHYTELLKIETDR